MQHLTIWNCRVNISSIIYAALLNTQTPQNLATFNELSCAPGTERPHKPWPQNDTLLFSRNNLPYCDNCEESPTGDFLCFKWSWGRQPVLSHRLFDLSKQTFLCFSKDTSLYTITRGEVSRTSVIWCDSGLFFPDTSKNMAVLVCSIIWETALVFLRMEQNVVYRTVCCQYGCPCFSF